MPDIPGYVDKDVAAAVWNECGRNATEFGARFGLSRSGARYWLAKHGLHGKIQRGTRESPKQGAAPSSSPDHPSFTFRGDTAEIVTPKASTLGSVADLLREHDLEPDEWEVINLTVNRWESNAGDGEIVPLKQIKLTVRRVTPKHFVMPARQQGVWIAPKRKLAPLDKPRTWVFCGDQQAPYEEPVLDEKFCNFLDDVRPTDGVLIGDTMDLPDISRHDENPEWHEPFQACIDGAGNLLLRYVTASPETRWRKLMGNHDERIRNFLVGKARAMYGIRRAAFPGEVPDDPAMSVQSLLRLDELGIELVQPNGGYAHAQVEVSEHLGARHGWLTGKQAAANSVSRRTHSMVLGHTHKQGIQKITIYDINGRPHTLNAIETGCMCRIEGGLGYAVDPDWVGGWATATVWPNGKFSVSLAEFDGRHVYWNDRTY